MASHFPDVDYRSRGDVSDGEFESIMTRYRSASDEAIIGLRGDRDIRYDVHSDERLDVWRPNGDALFPVVIAIHGGYWKMLSRHDTAFMARVLADREVATVTVDYTLAPGANLVEIVRQVRAAVAWVHTQGANYGLDPEQIHVLGSSAGAHLAAMCAVGGWQEEAGLPKDVVKSAMLLSGLFDLRPLVHTFANEWLNLDEQSASAVSPVLAPVSNAAILVARAEHEASGFHYQSSMFHEHWSTRGRSESHVISDRNHFDVFLELSNSESFLLGGLLRLIYDAT